MPVATLGNKFICFSCQAKFYDLNRPEAICPKCKANQKEAPKPKPASRTRAVEKVREEPVKPPVEDPDLEDVVATDDEPVIPAGEVAEEDDDDDDED